VILSVSSLLAERKMIGTLLLLRISTVAAMPSMTGIMMSRMMQCSVSFCATATASLPLYAVKTA